MRIWLSPAGQARHVWSIVSYYDWARAQMERNVNLEDWNAATSQTQVWDGGRMKNTVIGSSNCWLNFSKAKWMNGCCPGSSLYIFTLAKCSSGWHAKTFYTFKTIVDPCWDYSGTIVRVWFCVLCWLALAACVLLRVSENWKSRPKIWLRCVQLALSRVWGLMPSRGQSDQAPNLRTPRQSRDQGVRNQSNMLPFISQTFFLNCQSSLQKGSKSKRKVKYCTSLHCILLSTLETASFDFSWF